MSTVEEIKKTKQKSKSKLFKEQSKRNKKYVNNKFELQKQLKKQSSMLKRNRNRNKQQNMMQQQQQQQQFK